MKVLAEDLRCLDAHAHLGSLELKHGPKQAVRHYEMGVSIGALSLGTSFDGLLPWGHIDNRPFLRCLNGTGLCAWRLGDLRGAAACSRRCCGSTPATIRALGSTLRRLRGQDVGGDGGQRAMTRRRDPTSWTVVRLPERDLAEVILELAAPLLKRLGPAPSIEDARGALALAIAFWNASVHASKLWSIRGSRS